MATSFRCHCGSLVEVDDSKAAAVVECPSCHRRLQIPVCAQTSAAPPPEGSAVAGHPALPPVPPPTVKPLPPILSVGYSRLHKVTTVVLYTTIGLECLSVFWEAGRQEGYDGGKSTIGLGIVVVHAFVVRSAMRWRPFSRGILTGGIVFGILAVMGALALTFAIDLPKKNLALLFCALASVFLTLYAITFFHPQSLRAMRKAKGAMIGGAVLGLFLAPLISVTSLPGTMSLIVPASIHLGMSMSRTRCSNQLKQLHIALVKYADGHDGSLPADFSTLIQEKLIAPQIAFCPAVLSKTADRSQETLLAAHYGYIFGGHRLERYPSHLPLCWDDPSHHNGQGACLYSNGEVEWLDEAEWRKQVESAEKWLAEYLSE